jgi:hypothetical protein
MDKIAQSLKNRSIVMKHDVQYGRENHTKGITRKFTFKTPWTNLFHRRPQKSDGDVHPNMGLFVTVMVFIPLKALIANPNPDVPTLRHVCVRSIYDSKRENDNHFV